MRAYEAVRYLHIVGAIVIDVAVLPLVDLAMVTRPTL
jgi:hypothetical protein